MWREKYTSVTSRYRKARIIDYVMQSAGYKNRKTVIRLLSSKKAPPNKKKKGRRRIIGLKELQVIKKIWFLMGPQSDKNECTERGKRGQEIYRLDKNSVP